MPTPPRGLIYNDITETIGGTPLVRLLKFAKDTGVYANILAKLEFFNPIGAVKDRIGVGMVDALEQSGQLKPGGTLIEPTSGNTGIALAFVCAARGYNLILTMPESMSIERRKMLALLGAKLELTPAEKGMQGAIERATEMAQEIDGAIVPQQFRNPANVDIHAKTTGAEIWTDTAGAIDVFIAGVGTGGTLAGVAAVLKNHNPDIEVIAVEPEDSPVLSGGMAGPHNIQGIGAGFVPEILDTGMIDKVITIGNQTALDMARQLAAVEGIPCGISGGAALAAAVELGEQQAYAGKNIVVILPDFAERYLSTSLFDGL